MSNRVNSSNRPTSNNLSKTTTTWTNTIPAGGTLQVPATGNIFYVTFTTAPVTIKPSGGASNQYSTGKGLEVPVENSFALLQVSNPNAAAIVCQIVIGFDGYIDNTLIINETLTPQVTFPTYPVASAATSIVFTDKSGTAFVDANGGNWYAINRVAIIVSNLDTGATLLLQNTALTKSVAAIFPVTSLRLDTAGNFKINSGSNINAVASEIYQAIAATATP